MQLAFLPNVDFPFIGIQIPYQNSNPMQVEKEITKPVEETLSTLSGIKKLWSNSGPDGAFIGMEFNWGQEIDVLRMQVGEKVDLVRSSLPEGVGDILIFNFSSEDIPVIEGRISAKGVDLSQNYDLLEKRIINRIRRVKGVARVDLHGVAPREIRIRLQLAEIQEHGVDVGALINRLQAANFNMSIGKIDADGLRYNARIVGQFEGLEAIQEFRVNENGLKLEDIADITYREPPLTYGRHLNREQAIALIVFKESTANTVDVVHAVNRVIETEIDSDPLLQGIDLLVWQDQAEEITESLSGLSKAGLWGGLFAVLVLYFFLRRVDTTLIVSMAIPFSLVAACAILYLSGKNFNILSLTGLMLGVGMLVDNAVVVLESIYRHHSRNGDPKTSAVEGAGEVRTAVMAATLTTIIVFLPLIIGTKTELSTWLGEIGFSISIALACSLFVSLTLIPWMASRLLVKKVKRPSRLIEVVTDRYGRFLIWSLRRKWVTLLLVLGFVVVGFLPAFAKWMNTAQYAGLVNRRTFLLYDFQDFVYTSEAEEAVDTVEKVLWELKDEYSLKSIYSYFEENEAITVLTFNTDGYRDEEIKEVRKKIRDQLPVIPGVKLKFFEDSESGGDSTFFSVKLFGEDTTVLDELTQEAVRRLELLQDVNDVRASTRSGRYEVQVTLDRDRARKFGLSPRDMAQAFRFMLGGLELRKFNTGEREVDVLLALHPRDRENIEDLKNIVLRAPDGRGVPLGDIADFQMVRKFDEIRRENRKTKVQVYGVFEGEDFGETQEKISGIMNSFNLPSGYSWSFGDRIVEQGQENQQMLINIGLALALVYIVMASLFESLAHPFAIVLSIPFALPGVFWGLTLTGTPFNIMAQIGFLILMGIVVNNGIVLIDHVHQLRKKGLTREEAIVRGGRERMRPILMTATTTILGMLPLALGGSNVGNAYYYPLARTVMGGLAASTILTLVILPYMYVLIDSVAVWGRRLWSESRQMAPAAVTPAGPAQDLVSSSS
jgi:HAE1 family hydrophobic/amphiphilic exporter-1